MVVVASVVAAVVAGSVWQQRSNVWRHWGSQVGSWFGDGDSIHLLGSMHAGAAAAALAVATAAAASEWSRVGMRLASTLLVMLISRPTTERLESGAGGREAAGALKPGV